MLDKSTSEMIDDVDVAQGSLLINLRSMFILWFHPKQGVSVGTDFTFIAWHSLGCGESGQTCFAALRDCIAY